ncbi:MAG: TetR/AcrR family transcriptional regulator [Caulobacteraceae bacterium]
MNQLTVGGLAAVADAHRPNQRALAKRRTREKIVAAAKILFAERGYEGATIRDIAAAAGMSTGAVFASFTDKADLFIQIVEAEQAEIHAAMQAAAEGLKGRAAVAAMLDAAAERQIAELALCQAAMSALWTPGLANQMRRRLARRSAVPMLAAALRQDPCCGAPDAEFVAETVWEAHLSTLRHAALDRLTLDEVKARIREQLRLMLAGARRG